MGRHNAYPKEVRNYIARYASRMTIDDMVERVNERFGTQFDYWKMKAYYGNHKIHSGMRKTIYSDLFPEEICSLISENCKGKGHKEMASFLLLETGRVYTPEQIKSFYHNHGIDSGRTGRFEKGHEPANKGRKWDEFMSEDAQARSRTTCFKKGQKSINERPIGSRRIDKDGYILIKVNERGRWQQAHGQIPPNHVIRHLDGNPLNNNLDNLALVSMRENAVLNHQYAGITDKEIHLAAVGAAKLKIAITEKSKSRRKKR